jgi:hypothetical protein
MNWTKVDAVADLGIAVVQTGSDYIIHFFDGSPDINI